MPIEDAEMTRMVQREVNRRYIDSSRVDVKAIHGVVYLRGSIKKLRGYDIDLRHELEIINRVLRGKPGVRDVIIEIDFRG